MYRRCKLLFDLLRYNINRKIRKQSSSSSSSCYTLSAELSSFSHQEVELGSTNTIPDNPLLSISKIVFGSLRRNIDKKKSYVFSSGCCCLSAKFYKFSWIYLRKVTNRMANNPSLSLFRKAAMVVAGALVSVCLGKLETIPYTLRTHFILLSKSMEKRIGEYVFEEIKKTYKGEILPAIHPESIRVRLIAKEIIDALHKDMAMALSQEDDKLWIQHSRTKNAARTHLEGIKWEVIVVDKPTVNAYCFPAGKIVVFTGLLELFKSDAEVATVIEHEVGHVVARHGAERLTQKLWFVILQSVLTEIFMPSLVEIMSDLFLKLPFSRRNEIEADHIGLQLLASAGYDPRVAPKVYEKLGGEEEEYAVDEYFSTHPSGKRRSQLLAQDNVMEKALMIYRQVQAAPKEATRK